MMDTVPKRLLVILKDQRKNQQILKVIIIHQIYLEYKNELAWDIQYVSLLTRSLPYASIYVENVVGRIWF